MQQRTARPARASSFDAAGPPLRSPDGFRYHPGLLDTAAQQRLVEAIRTVVAEAPFFHPAMPRSGKPFTVRMSNCGPLGWVSDKDGGYRYQATHPVTGRAWPAMPEAVLAIWRMVADYPAPPEACLINLYRDGARMGLHRDADEAATEAPVVSISLGDTAVFRIGSTTRRGPTRTVRLASGDVCVLAGDARHAYHGIDRVLAGSADLLTGGGRLNLTLRRVTVPATAG